MNLEVRHNRKVHDAAASTYERAHPEIFNATEQARIVRVLEDALGMIGPPAGRPFVLDFGAGTGNLTSHLLRLGSRVVAADVSPRSLECIAERHGHTGRVETIELNGLDLAGIATDSLDMIAAYSVLHHVPDYLAITAEFARVVRPGGVIYIDHEAAPRCWHEDDGEYGEYLAAMRMTYGPSLGRRVLRTAANITSLAAWRRLLHRRLLGLRDEGDIHVTVEDHIEWPEIERLLQEHCSLIVTEDYLLCREPGLERPLHRRFEAKCADMRMALFRVA